MTFDITKINKLTCPFCFAPLQNLFKDDGIADTRVCTSCYKNSDHYVSFCIKFENELPSIIITTIDEYTITTFFPRKSHKTTYSIISAIEEIKAYKSTNAFIPLSPRTVKERVQILNVDEVFEVNPTTPKEIIKTIKVFQLLK